jgi:dienelactone hydrolase
MKRKIAARGIAFLVVFLVIAGGYAEEWVSFEGRTPTGAKLQLTGILSVPEGNGPFPAVAMLCGCGGLRDSNDAKQQRAWAERLLGWGYASLRLDSFGPRGYGDICNNLDVVSPSAIAYDAYSAQSFLRAGVKP